MAVAADLDVGGLTIADVATKAGAAVKAVNLAHHGEVHALAKGSLHTDVLMHPVVAETPNLRGSVDEWKGQRERLGGVGKT